jgi:hypothetical protein
MIASKIERVGKGVRWLSPPSAQILEPISHFPKRNKSFCAFSFHYVVCVSNMYVQYVSNSSKTIVEL